MCDEGITRENSVSKNYEKMWEELGLNLGAHDALLEVLGKGYQDIYLAQRNRPEVMGYFDFVMSEVTSLLAKGEGRQDIALGLHRSVVRRAAGMLKRVSVEVPIVFAGGVAQNVCMQRLLEEALEKRITVPDDPQIIGAYGAALLAARQ